MTDIEQLRQDVIDELRYAVQHTDPRVGYSCHPRLFQRLREKIRVLDEAERPDPWMLLREVRDGGCPPSGRPLTGRIEAALAWKETQND